MLGGILLIVAGILMVIYPPLLSIIVASLFILMGVAALTVGYYHRKMHKRYDNPAVEFFLRF